MPVSEYNSPVSEYNFPVSEYRSQFLNTTRQFLNTTVTDSLNGSWHVHLWCWVTRGGPEGILKWGQWNQKKATRHAESVWSAFGSMVNDENGFMFFWHSRKIAQLWKWVFLHLVNHPRTEYLQWLAIHSALSMVDSWHIACHQTSDTKPSSTYLALKKHAISTFWKLVTISDTPYMPFLAILSILLFAYLAQKWPNRGSARSLRPMPSRRRTLCEGCWLCAAETARAVGQVSHVTTHLYSFISYTKYSYQPQYQLYV